MYENLVQEFSITNELYDINLEVIHPVSGQEVASKILGDEMPETKTKRVSYSMNSNQTEIHENKDNQKIQAFAVHAHINDCYVGHNHEANGCGTVICPCGSTSVSLNPYGRQAELRWQCSSCSKPLLRLIRGTSNEGARTYNLSIYVPSLDQEIELCCSSISLTNYDPKVNTFASIIENNVVNNMTINQFASTFRSIYEYAGIDLTSGNYCGYDYDEPGGINPNSIFIKVVYSDKYNYASRSRRQQIHMRIQGHNVTATREENSYDNTVVYDSQAVYKIDPQTRMEQYVSGNAVSKELFDSMRNQLRMRNSELETKQINIPTFLKMFEKYPNLISWFRYDIYTLPKSCGITENDTNPICNQVVTTIIATNQVQNIIQGSNIITTATATYLDGHTGIVNCSSNFNPNLTGTQIVTLSYSGKVIDAKTTGILTCTIQVTVRSAATLTSITVSPSTQNIPRYTDPVFNVTAYYSNGTNKAVTGYTISGFNNSQLGNQIVTITYTDNGVSRSATVIVVVNNLTKICPICGTIYHLDDNDKDNGCPNCISTITGITATPDNCVVSKGDPLPIFVEAIYRNGNKATVTSWSSNFYPNVIGIQEVTVMYQGYSANVLVEVKGNKTCDVCGKEYSLNQDGTDPGCPYCKTEVISIEVFPKNVTIEKHMPLPITVTATYRDGHSEAITGWHTDLIVDVTGTFNVNVYYQNVEDNLTVTIRDDRLIICPICGLEYVFSEYPDGCPDCSKTVVGIEAGLRNGGTKVQYKANLDLEITLNFKDNHKELTNTGWTTEGYRPDVLGLQTITVYYKEFTTTLVIEVVNTLSGVYCPNGHYYYLNDDGTDPGCPYCNETSTDNAVFYFISVYTEEIIDKLYADGVYNLKAGDYLVVTIKPKHRSVSSSLVNLFSTKELKKEHTYGGEIL